jgi:phenylacetate-CoA ligase
MINLQELVLNSPRFIRDVFINAYGYKLSKERFNSSFWKYYDQIINNLNLEREEIENLYFSNLKNSLIYAKKSKFYSNLFKENDFSPEEMSSFSDIESIPLLDKQTIKENFNDIVIDVKDVKPILHSSSGTTGPKFQFYISNELIKTKKAAFMYRQYSLLGIKPFDRRITIGGRLFTNRKPYWSYNKFENQLLLSAHHIQPETIDSYISKIIQFNPIFIQGHPSAILMLGEYILKHELLLNCRIKAIFTTGETLNVKDKVIIQNAFNTRVFQQYGSGESVISAIEKPDDTGYFSDIEMGYIETVDVNKDSNYEIIGTSFLNPVFPFIRYRMNDYAEPALNSKTNDSYPKVFDNVLGRVDDYIINESGRIILPVSIRMVLKPYINPGEAYQLIQQAPIQFKLRLQGCFEKERIEKISNVLKKELGYGIELLFSQSDSIVTAGGKIRNIINEIKN